MVEFPNNYKFKFCCASGALGFDGKGYFFEKPSFWLKIIRPEEFAVITKTLTFYPRKGNYRWWKFWQTCQPIKGGFINSLGLPNPGYLWWIDKVYPKLKRKVIVSITASKIYEALFMARDMNNLTNIAAIEYNMSCPNVEHDLNEQYDCLNAVIKNSRHPVIVKLGYNMPFIEIAKNFEGRIQALNLINTIPWSKLFTRKSPLARYGFEGGVSGKHLRPYALSCLKRIKEVVKTPVISGGGILCKADVDERFESGADAVAFGTIFIWTPWRPNQIIREYRC